MTSRPSRSATRAGCCSWSPDGHLERADVEYLQDVETATVLDGRCSARVAGRLLAVARRRSAEAVEAAEQARTATRRDGNVLEAVGELEAAA